MIAIVSIVSVLVMAVAVVLFIAVNSEGSGRLARLGRRLFEVPVQPLPPIEDRSDTRKRLEEQYRWLTDDDGEATAFLFGEVKAAFDATRDG